MEPGKLFKVSLQFYTTCKVFLRQQHRNGRILSPPPHNNFAWIPSEIQWFTIYTLCSWHLFIYLLIYLFCFLGVHPGHMEVPGLGVQSELQLPAYVIATAMLDLSQVWDLHHSSRQHQIPNPLREVRDQTHNLMVTSQIHFCCARKELHVHDI